MYKIKTNSGLLTKPSFLSYHNQEKVTTTPFIPDYRYLRIFQMSGFKLGKNYPDVYTSNSRHCKIIWYSYFQHKKTYQSYSHSHGTPFIQQKRGSACRPVTYIAGRYAELSITCKSTWLSTNVLGIT